MIKGIMAIEDTLLKNRQNLESLIQRNAHLRSEVEAVLQHFPETMSWGHVCTDEAKNLLRSVRGEVRSTYKDMYGKPPSDKETHAGMVTRLAVHFDDRRSQLVEKLALNEKYLQRIKNT